MHILFVRSFCSSILLFSITLVSSAQGLILETDHIDLGQIAATEYPPVTVEFTNTSDERLAILLVEKSKNLKVGYEPRFYAPGENGNLVLFYDARNTGSINEVALIHTNLSEHAIELEVTGTVVSILECFPDPGNLLKRQVKVIDSLSKEPIQGAEVEFIHNYNPKSKLSLKTDRNGEAIEELPIGQYQASASAPNYTTLKKEFFLPKSKPFVIFEMTPIQLAPPPPPALAEAITEAPEMNPPAYSPDLPENLYAANNLILLLDVSTSMKSSQKFTLLQQSINNLSLVLREIDRVSIITYSSEASTVVSGVAGNQKDVLTQVVQNLQPYGITRGVKGLETAYNLAEKNYIPSGNNQIILATDGEFSEKGLSDEFYSDMISGYTQKGITLSILGFGINEEAIERMKKMTSTGQGSFILIRSEEFVRDVLIDEIKARSFLEE